ncbi:hypothetical protein [Comamonas testosteroni]|nr:hypothetical protein [Comamonas testosteroni]KWT68580.1 hypothetical protein APV28_2717 [Comamonas testosteroni]
MQITEANVKRLALLLSLGFRKLADELQTATAYPPRPAISWASTTRSIP